MDKLGEILGGLSSKQDHISRQFTGPGGQIVDRFEFFSEKLQLQDSGLRIYKQGLGSSFIIGHSTLGKIGSGLSPQPYIGDSRTGWSQIGPSGVKI
jgi:hypothetical protein